MFVTCALAIDAWKYKMLIELRGYGVHGAPRDPGPCDPLAKNEEHVPCSVPLIPYSSKNFVIFVRCKITKSLFTKIFSPMGRSIGAAMNHFVCKKLCRLNHGSFRPRKFGANMPMGL